MFDWMNKDFLLKTFLVENGKLYWRQHPFRSFVGKEADSACTGGYKYVRINGSSIPVHKIIYFLEHGTVPKMVDHIDGDTSNNLPSNLRAANYEQNNRNARIRVDNKTGSKGLRLCKNGKWQVYVRVNGKQKSFGVYEDFELADLVGMEARNKYHGEFARHK